ncbi:hypothetical protein CDIK_0613 [Cucumispora dikerogammari]|nr:hypothetical protein CDIK_0613 [Cucumispora dikerogammari]
MSRKTNKEFETQTIEFKEKLLQKLKDIHKNKKERLLKKYKLQTDSIKTIQEDVIKTIDKKEKMINELKRRIDKINKTSKDLENTKEEISKELKALKKSISHKFEQEKNKAKATNSDISKELNNETKKIKNKVEEFSAVKSRIY